MTRDELQARLKSEVMVFDGGFGTELYRRNFFINTSYEGLVLSNSKVITDIHTAYIQAGCDVITTDTYNANAVKLAAFGMGDRAVDVNRFAAALAREAVEKAAGEDNGRRILVCGSIGPMDVSPEDREACQAAEAALRAQFSALVAGGVDFITLETLSNLKELRLALKALQEEAAQVAWMPSFVFDEQGHLADGAGVTEILAELAAHTPAAFGLNCGTGPETTLEAVKCLQKAITLPMVVQPSAGTPRQVDNRFLAMTTPEYFTTYALRYVQLGARAVGGCCGIGPEHIADLARSLKPLARTEHAEVFAVAEEKKAAVAEQAEMPSAQKSPLGAKIADGKWVKLLEMLPPKGFDLSDTLAKAEKIREAGFDAVNLPDGPRAGCRLSQIVTAIEIQEKTGLETIVHCCCRDRNLISLQSMILGCMAKNLRNILFITGDPPKLGDYPFSSGVFDVDSIGMLKLQRRLNRGIDIGGFPLGPAVKTAIFAGTGADPNAIDQEREYRRLAEKVEAGAEFIVTQPVFDTKVFHDFIKRVKPMGCPVIAGVWPFASYRNAVFMKNEVPGVVVPDWILQAMEKAGNKIAQREEGIRIARQMLSEIAGEVNGVATSAPLGRIDTAIDVCRGF